MSEAEGSEVHKSRERMCNERHCNDMNMTCLPQLYLDPYNLYSDKMFDCNCWCHFQNNDCTHVISSVSCMAILLSALCVMASHGPQLTFASGMDAPCGLTVDASGHTGARCEAARCLPSGLHAGSCVRGGGGVALGVCRAPCARTPQAHCMP